MVCAVALALGPAIGGKAKADLIVVPNANAAVAGNTDNRFPFLVNGGMRYQQVFAASQFAALGGPQLVTDMALRNGIFVAQPFTATIASIQIALSTTALAPDALSATFANNIGADNKQVFSGSLTLSSTNGPGPGNTHVFDIVIHFDTPFLYDPAQGNLLLDVRNNSGADAFVGSDFFDAVTAAGDPVSRVFGPEGDPNATVGALDTLGLIVQFGTASTVVPEPSSLVLLSVGGVALLGGYVRRRRSIAT
jgi:hypothetical protein